MTKSQCVLAEETTLDSFTGERHNSGLEKGTGLKVTSAQA